MKPKFFFILLAFTAMAGTETDQAAHATDIPNGREILEQTLEIPVPDSMGAVYEIAHTDHHGQVKERKALLIFAKDPKNPRVQKQIISFLSPRDLKGTAQLTENVMSWGDEYSSKSWIYNPLFRRTKLNSISNWRNRQFGSAMSVFDGLHHNLDWFEAENQGMEKVGEQTAWKLNIKVTDEQVRERSNYGRVVRWIDTDTLQTLKLEVFNNKDELVKTTDISLTEVEGFWMVNEMSVSLIRNDGRKEVTKVTISNIKLNPSKAKYSSLFNQRALERGIPLGLQKEILKGQNID